MTTLNAKMLDYGQLEQGVSRWADSEENIRGLVVVGSRASPDFAADSYSDLDMVLFTTEAEKYAPDPSWLSEIGTVWLSYLNTTGAGDPEWLVVFEGGLKCDVVIAKANIGLSLSQSISASPYLEVFRRGMRILLDKTGSTFGQSIDSMAVERPGYPAPEEFRMAVDGALISAGRLAKYLRRGDLWRSQQVNNGEMKHRLLVLIEWQAIVAFGPNLDAWYEGRNLMEWAAPQVIESLPTIYASYDYADLKRALNATLKLIESLATEIASRLGYDFPTPEQVQALNWLSSLT